MRHIILKCFLICKVNDVNSIYLTQTVIFHKPKQFVLRFSVATKPVKGVKQSSDLFHLHLQFTKFHKHNLLNC